MYPNLLAVEEWVRNLSKEVIGLIYERPYRLEAGVTGNYYIYSENPIFKDKFFLRDYTEKALSVLSKLDTYRDDKLLDRLKTELRNGQFDNERNQALNKYIKKVLLSLDDLWMKGFDYEDFHSSHLPKYVQDCETYSDGVKYYYKDEKLELGNILYRIHEFFWYSGAGYKANPDEYTIDFVLRQFVDYSPEEPKTHSEVNSKNTGVRLNWNGAADTLYDIFRQLKNHHLPDGSTLLEGSYDQIALFIQQSFIGFDEVSTSTIRGKLTKNNRPKKSFNRVNLDFTEPD